MTLKNKILIAVLACCAVFVAILGIYRYKHSLLGYTVGLIIDSKIHPDLKYTHLPPEGKNIPVQSFNSIKAHGAFDIILQHGISESVVVKDFYPGDLKVSNERDTLMLIFTDSSYSKLHDRETNIYVTYKQLNNIKTDILGDIKTLDTIKAARFTIDLDGIGNETLLLHVDTLAVSMDVGGTLSLSGKAHYADFKVNGIDTLKAKDFIVDVLHTGANGLVAASVKADSELYMDATLGGTITYYGNARVMVQDSEGGMGHIICGN